MSFIPSNLYFRLHQQSTIVSPIHVTLAGRFSSSGTYETVVSCRCMLEEETVCRLVIAENEKRDVSKVVLNKDSRNRKIFLLQQSDFHKHVCWSRLQSSPCSCARGTFYTFLFASRIFLGVRSFNLFAVFLGYFVCEDILFAVCEHFFWCVRLHFVCSVPDLY